MDQKHLTRLQPAARHNVGVNRKGRLTQGGGLIHWHIARNGQRVVLVGQRVFRIAPARQQRSHAVAD